jgi:hypothetical protein
MAGVAMLNTQSVRILNDNPLQAGFLII